MAMTNRKGGLDIPKHIALVLLWISWVAEALVPIDLPMAKGVPPSILATRPVSFIDGSSALLLSETPSFSTKGYQKDRVVRVLDANTVKLEKAGIVTLAGVRMPTPGNNNFAFPECLTYTPAYKVRQLVPSKTEVWVRLGPDNGRSTTPALLVRREDELLVNQELVKTGFGRVQKITGGGFEGYLDTEQLKGMQAEAKERGLGIFKRCDAEAENAGFEAQFEPLEFTVETQWGDDGGKLVVKERESDRGPPDNPGDIRGCSDFSTYEDALRWYEKFYPFYGDVAKLDRDGDGVPCPGLPHTRVAEKYRMKVPTGSVGTK